jgi:Tol biopolymer transport system component
VSGQPSRLVYVREGTLLAQGFDSEKLRCEGDPAPLAKNVAGLAALHAAAFWLSDTGLLVYRNGLAFERMKLVWRHRDGQRLGEAAPEYAYTALRLSPDGKQVAIGRREPTGHGLLWIVDFTRGVTTRLTSNAQIEAQPVWSPNGRQVAFGSIRGGVYQIFRIELNGVNAEVQLSDGGSDKYLCDWSRDGKYLLYTQGSPGAFHIWAKPNPAIFNGEPDLPVVRTASDEVDGQFSPDGKWMAYSSNASGRYEIYVMSFSGNTDASVGRWQISSRGGRAPRWRGDGQELYYLTIDDNKLMAVTLRSVAGALQAETPHELFAASVPADVGDIPVPYDVTADGQRFLLEESAGNEASIPLTAVVNWQAGLKK